MTWSQHLRDIWTLTDDDLPCAVLPARVSPSDYGDTSRLPPPVAVKGTGGWIWSSMMAEIERDHVGPDVPDRVSPGRRGA